MQRLQSYYLSKINIYDILLVMYEFHYITVLYEKGTHEKKKSNGN